MLFTRLSSLRAAAALLALAALPAPAAPVPPPLDVVIRHGRIVDGSGQPAYVADIGIAGGQIVRIGPIPERAKQEIDARGLTVAPGFIDVHTHAENIDMLGRAENFARMGVTTLILGNCGSSELDVAKLFQRLTDMTVSVNVATLIGHGTVRGHVMGGSFMRPPGTSELEEMKGWVEKAMTDGALGLSTGLIYLPGTFAATEEIVALASVAGAADGIYVSHMRNEGDEIFEALAELFRIAQEAGVRAQVSHIKLSGKPNWGLAEKVLAAIEAARDRGLDVTQDMYVYPASSTGISQLIPTAAREGGKYKERLADPGEKARIVAEMKSELSQDQRESFDYAMIASYAANPALNGLNIAQAALKSRGSDSLDDQVELILEIHARGGASGVFHSMNEQDLQTFLRHPLTMIGADSSIRQWMEGVPHPRGYGNNARVLARYVRDLNLLSLEEAVRRMTSLPADTFRLKHRGRILEGAWADVIVFDPAKVSDRATFEQPHQYATGFKAVLVNGEIIVQDDRHTGARGGRMVRRDE